MVKPDLAIMDAIVGMEGDGPAQGTPRKVGVVLASKSCVALDVIASEVIGLNPLKIPTTSSAIKRKIEIPNLKDVEVVGESVNDVKIDFKKPSSTFKKLPPFITNSLSNFFSIDSYIADSNCKKSGLCVEACPVHAISEYVKLFSNDKEKCMLCYCCHELCPNSSVELKRFGLRKDSSKANLDYKNLRIKWMLSKNISNWNSSIFPKVFSIEKMLDCYCNTKSSNYFRSGEKLNKSQFKNIILCLVVVKISDSLEPK